MKDFAKSIVCNTKAEVGNELTSYEKAKKSDLEKRLKKEEQLLEDAKKMLRGKLSDDDRIGFQIQKEDCEKNVSRLKEEIRKIGNKKVGNTIPVRAHIKEIEKLLQRGEKGLEKYKNAKADMGYMKSEVDYVTRELKSYASQSFFDKNEDAAYREGLEQAFEYWTDAADDFVKKVSGELK